MVRRTKKKTTGRPLLLPLVYLATLTLIGVSGGALAMLGSEHVRATAITTTVAGDQAAIRDFVASNVTTADLEPATFDSVRRAALDRSLADVAERHGYHRITVVSRDGSTLAGDWASSAVAAEHERAVASGQPTATISEAADGLPILTETIPVAVDGRVELVVTLERDASSVIAAAENAWRDLVLVTVGATTVLAILLRTIFKAAGIRLRHQASALTEARRRDNLTGLVNHPTAVDPTR